MPRSKKIAGRPEVGSYVRSTTMGSRYGIVESVRGREVVVCVVGEFRKGQWRARQSRCPRAGEIKVGYGEYSLFTRGPKGGYEHWTCVNLNGWSY